MLHESAAVDDRVRREALELQPVEHLLPRQRVQMRQKRLARAAGMHRLARADGVSEPDRLRSLPLVHREGLIAVADCEAHGLAGNVAQPLQLRFGRAAQIELVPDAVGHLEQAETEVIALVAFVDTDKAGFSEGRQHPVSRRAGQAGAVGDLAEAEARILGDDIEEGQAAPQRLRAGDLPPAVVPPGLVVDESQGPGIRQFSGCWFHMVVSSQGAVMPASLMTPW